MQLARLYLRASVAEQDATRASEALERFAAERGLTIAGSYVENESGASLKRPELFRLLADSRPGQIMLIEGVDRLSRLTESDWRKLRADIETKQIRVVAMDLPTSWMLTADDDFTSRMLGAINGMMLDMLAAIARKDYEDRRRRQAEGIAKAKANNRYCGRPEDVRRNSGIAAMLRSGSSWSQIQATSGFSRATVLKISKRLKESSGDCATNKAL